MFSKLIHLGGLFNGSKRLLGVVTLGFTAVQLFAPNYSTIVSEVLQIFGLSLLPIGVADAIRKAKD